MATSFFALDLSKFPQPCHTFKTTSGFPVCRYALGGAARSDQPQSLPLTYVQRLKGSGEKGLFETTGAPCFFYYNPHRYPAFMNGIEDICKEKDMRRNMFVISGGADRSFDAMEKRLKDSLARCGDDYLDMFILEYVCPYDLEEKDGNMIVDPDSELGYAIRQAQEWKEKGLVRHVGASTHSHRVGAALAINEGLDTLMLRYSMSHQNAANRLSFPACSKERKPVLAFCTTRWNKLQNGHDQWNGDSPTTGDCLSFALATKPSPVEIVLHSARDEVELDEALLGFRSEMPNDELDSWSAFGRLSWNQDGFDEYPEESREA